MAHNLFIGSKKELLDLHFLLEKKAQASQLLKEEDALEKAD